MTNTTQLLTPKQLTIIKIIYKFRFVTTELLSSYRSTDKNASYFLLKKLHENNYLGRRYDSSYKLQGKAARYYLTNSSIKLLKEKEGFNERVLEPRRKDAQVSESFVIQTLEAFKTALVIQTDYPDIFSVFTQYELDEYTYFPRPLPALYIRRSKVSLHEPYEYFIDIVTDTPFFIVKKRIDQYIEHYENGEWKDRHYPVIVLLTKNDSLRKKIETDITMRIETGSLGEDEMTFKVMTKFTS